MIRLPTLLALALALPALLSGGEKELLGNPGFEKKLKGWSAMKRDGRSEFVVDADVKRSGKRALRVDRDSSGKPCILRQLVSVKKDEGTVRVSGWLRSDAGMRISFSFQFMDKRGQTIGQGHAAQIEGDGSGEFAELTAALDVPEGAKKCAFDLKIQGGGSLWLDDCSVMWSPSGAAGAAAAGALANPGFESGTEGWTVHEAGSGGLDVELDTANVAAGTSALLLTRRSTRLYPLDALVQEVPLSRKAKKVTLTARTRVGEGARGFVSIVVLSEVGAALATEKRELGPGGTEFSKVELELQLPEGAARARVHLGVLGRGRVWYDEVELGR